MTTPTVPTPFDAAQHNIRRAGLITTLAALQRIRPLLEDTRHIAGAIKEISDELEQLETQ